MEPRSRSSAPDGMNPQIFRTTCGVTHDCKNPSAGTEEAHAGAAPGGHGHSGEGSGLAVSRSEWSWQARLKGSQFMRSHHCIARPTPGKTISVTAMCRMFDVCSRSWREGASRGAGKSGAAPAQEGSGDPSWKRERLWITPDHSRAGAGRFRCLPEFRCGASCGSLTSVDGNSAQRT